MFRTRKSKKPSFYKLKLKPESIVTVSGSGDGHTPQVEKLQTTLLKQDIKNILNTYDPKSFVKQEALESATTPNVPIIQTKSIPSIAGTTVSGGGSAPSLGKGVPSHIALKERFLACLK